MVPPKKMSYPASIQRCFLHKKTVRCSTRTISIKVLVKFLYRSVLRSYFIYLENCYLQRIIKTNWWIFHVNVSAATRPPSLQIIFT